MVNNPSFQLKRLSIPHGLSQPGLDRLAIIGMHAIEKVTDRGHKLRGIKTKDTTHFIRPGETVGMRIPFPAAQMRLSLRHFQALLALTQGHLRLLSLDRGGYLPANELEQQLVLFGVADAAVVALHDQRAEGA